MNDSSVTRTASDALQAKAAAINIAGYRPHVPLAETYVNLLQRFNHEPKRQTPLVHAGYLMRIQAVLSSITNFVKSLGGTKAQFILLGGGMDVTGIWAGHFAQFNRIIEIDLPSVCLGKKRLLRQERLIEFDELLSTSDCFRGSLAKDPSTAFSLVAKDLRSNNLQWSTILEGIWDPDLPTLILSEVVLAYVGEVAVDRILSSWTKALRHDHACLVLLEPLGPPSSDIDLSSNTVLQSYQNQYAQQFRAKLDRAVQSDTNLFAPLGKTSMDVARRIQKTGYCSVVAASMATVTAPFGFTAREPFDEHAALLLHAQSYVVACSFPSASTSSLFRRIMSPWTSDVVPFQASDQFWIASVDRTEEVAVKKLFFDGYDGFSKTYKSVNKLMQGTLKKDIVFTEVDPENEGIEFVSHFSKFYEDRGGCFVVAIDSVKEEIAGFVALTRASSKAKGVLSKCPVTFEVHRLFVVPDYRSKGVADLLMDAVQQVGLSKCPPNAESVSFVASTLNVLPAANRFYQRRGFSFEGEEILGDVILRHYVLQVPKLWL